MYACSLIIGLRREVFNGVLHLKMFLLIYLMNSMINGVI